MPTGRVFRDVNDRVRDKVLNGLWNHDDSGVCVSFEKLNSTPQNGGKVGNRTIKTDSNWYL